MNAKAILQMAERLAQKGDTGALKLLVRQASLPLFAEAMLGWTTGRKAQPFLERVIPLEILQELQARPALGNHVNVDLAEDTAISFPWSEERMEKALSRLAYESWSYDRINHYAYRYLPLGVVFFYNGLHSGAVGVLKREGQLQAEEVDLGPLYEAGLRIEWRRKGLFNGEEVPHAVLGSLAKPIPEVNHALLLALGEVLHRHGIRL